MVNPTKYDDFLEQGRVVKQYHDTDVEFVQYKCPMEGCDDLVNVRADDIDKRKSTRCLAHLKICKAATAAQDPRVCGKRKAPEPTTEPEPSETRLTRREEELVLRNDALQQQNCSTRAELDDVRRQMRAFEEQMERMQRQMDDGDRERERLQRQVDESDQKMEAIANAVGLKTPPVPELEVVLERLKGIQKSAAVQAAFGVSGSSNLKKEHDRLKRIVEDVAASASSCARSSWGSAPPVRKTLTATSSPHARAAAAPHLDEQTALARTTPQSSPPRLCGCASTAGRSQSESSCGRSTVMNSLSSRSAHSSVG